MKGVSNEDPSRLVRKLTGAILGLGGWVLSRGANDTGVINKLFEFERQTCLDIYSVLIAAGIDLDQSSHIRVTEIASIELEVQTSPERAAMRSQASQAV
jgi:hypothetical protein